MKTLLTILFAFACSLLTAQNWKPPASMGMGDISATITESASLFTNQAGLSKTKNGAFLGGMERRYFWADVNLIGAGVVLPTRSGTFGLQLQHFGITDFKRQKIGLAYGRQLRQNIRLGGQLNYFRTAIPEYGSNNVFSFEIGVQADLTEELMIGTHVSNPMQTAYLEDEKWPTIFQVGLLYKVSKKAALALEMEKDIEFSTRIKSGILYKPVDKFEFRMGYSSNPSNFHLGISFLNNKKLELITAVKYDMSLGLSIGFGMRYSLREN